VYNRKEIQLNAKSSYEAQVLAAKFFKVKKSYEVTVMLADIEHVPC
jgi:hypothetical protein